MSGLIRLRGFIQAMTRLADQGGDGGGGDGRWLTEGRDLLAGLIAVDDWLPPAMAEPGPSYRQNLLHCDPAERFCIVSFVWGPGQRTPVHNHTVWGLVGMLRGEEISTEMRPQPGGGPMRPGQVDRLRPGEVAAVSADTYDIHVVENAFADRSSISIHCYGGNIGAIARSVFDPATGATKRFISGYSNPSVPNIWDRSQELAA
ncbi:MAG: cysteine dioxygenase [Belnapia sp.]|nr:cysteine dioxygenase [Belnapia sp.]